MTTKTDQATTVEATLRVVQSLSEEQAGDISRQLERAVRVECCLRKLVGAVEFYTMMVGRPMTLHQRAWDEMRLALGEGIRGLRG